LLNLDGQSIGLKLLPLQGFFNSEVKLIRDDLMSYISFDKLQLINLEYSLGKELLRSNRSGAYATTTLLGCNTRKYHGLLILPLPELDGGVHVLLSSLDETVIQREASFNLGIHKYRNVYQPKGHKYIRDFVTDPIPKTTYRVGGVVLTKEILFAHHNDRIMVRYTLVDAHSPTTLQFKPFLAFRNRHALSKENQDVNRKYERAANGIRVRMYPGYPDLFMQFSKEMEYTHVPDWYNDIEYDEEARRGYEYHEDLYVPGFFELPIKKGESIIFAAGIEEADPATLNRLFQQEIRRRTPRDSFEHCLENAAQQFFVDRAGRTEVVNGFPWGESESRHAFISLPGLCLSKGNEKLFKPVADYWLSALDGGMLPGRRVGQQWVYDSVDSSLWFIWALHKWAKSTLSLHKAWALYGKKIKSILESYEQGTRHRIRMQENGLLYAGTRNHALTWMNAVVNGRPLLPRNGYAVEVNALWYNAIKTAIELAGSSDLKFVNHWTEIAEKIPRSFNDMFWDQNHGYCADYVDDDRKDWTLRPNQVIAASMPYSPLDERRRKMMLDVIRKDLLTPRGLRTLAPNHADFQAVCTGSQEERDFAAFNGSVWPWLFGHFAEAYLKVHQRSGVGLIRGLYEGFEEEMKVHGIGSVPELFDGAPTYNPGGAISFAASTAELLRVRQMLADFEEAAVSTK
jgi:predicted glycogen debranching enzyme